MKRVIFLAITAIGIVAFLIIWSNCIHNTEKEIKVDSPSQGAENFTALFEKANLQSAKPPRLQQQNDEKDNKKLHFILSRASIKMNQAACSEKIAAIKHALEIPNRTIIASVFNDMTKNQCSTWQIKNSRELLKTTLTENNLVAFIDDLMALHDTMRGMPFLALFREGIKELEKNPSEEFKNSFFAALQDHIENSASLLEISVGTQIVKELGEKNLLSSANTDTFTHLYEELDRDREILFQFAKDQNQHYPLIAQLKPTEEIASYLGIDGVNAVFLEGFRIENQIVEKFRTKLSEIIK